MSRGSDQFEEGGGRGPGGPRDDYGDLRRYVDYGAVRGYRDIPRPLVDGPNYLPQASLVTLFCCLIPGIVAIVNAAQVNSKLVAGDYEGAQRASDLAKVWCWISF